MADGRLFYGLALQTVRSRALAVWSDRAALRAQWLDREGRTEGRAATLGAACRGGVAAGAVKDGVLIACLRPDEGATLYRLNDDLSPSHSLSLGEAGRISQGIALASKGKRVLAAWLDATLESARIWRATVAGGQLLDTRVVSNRGVALGSPSVALHGRQEFVVWAEKRAADAFGGRVMAFDGRGAPRSLLQTHRPFVSAPTLVLSAEQRWLALRDVRGTRSRLGLYVTPLNRELRPKSKPKRVVRATGPTPPRLCACMGGLVAATPRTFSSDLFVGVVWASSDLRHTSGEQEFFQDRTQFTRAAVACLGERALVLIAERGTTYRPTTHLRSVSFRCD